VALKTDFTQPSPDRTHENDGAGMSPRLRKAHHSYPFKNAVAFRSSHCRAESLRASASDGDATNPGINGHRASKGTE
jgi:hypothetical protein